MTAHLRWAKGGEARVLAIDAQAVVLRSTVPSPPGSRIDGKTAEGDAVRVKVHSSKKQEDGAFVIEGRALDMTRAMRLKLSGA